MNKIIILFLLYSLNGISKDNLPNEDKSALVKEAIKKSIELMNKDMPHQLDEYTRVDSVSFNNNEILYNYSMMKWKLSDVIEFKPKFIDMQKPELVYTSCNNEHILLFLDSNIDITYNYYDLDNKFFTKITIKKSDCKKH